MQLHDFSGKTDVHSEKELLARLTTVRRGEYGAFVLCQTGFYPELSIHVHGEVAHLIYSRGEDHPGYQPTGCPGEVRFLLISGTLADAICMPDAILVSVERAYQAAIEFFKSQELPPSIPWEEL